VEANLVATIIGEEEVALQNSVQLQAVYRQNLLVKNRS